MSRSIAQGGSRPVALSDRQGFDRRWFAPNLQSVFVPTRSEEVADCVTAAINAYGRNVKVTSGRHCYENFVYNDTTRAVIDMSALNHVGFDPARNAFYVDAGAENWTVYRTLLNGFNKTLPAGSCYSVGAGGHITGGGYGLLSRLHGLTVDHLTGVDIVTWDAGSGRAELRHVSAQSDTKDEQDLFWALCGAGCGNFGVIVRYYFADLPDAPDHATLHTLAWNWSDLDQSSFGDLLAAYAELVVRMPRTDFGLLKLNHVSNAQIGLILQMASEAGMTEHEHRDRAEAAVQQAQDLFAEIVPSVPLENPLGGHPGYMTTAPATDAAQHVTYLEALQTLNGSGANQFGKYKSAYMKKGFPPVQVAAIYKWLHTTPELPPGDSMSQSLLQVDSYGGAVNDRSSDATAVPQRSSILKLQYQTYWINASRPGEGGQAPYDAQAQAHIQWINDFYSEVYAAYGGTPDPARDTTGTVDGTYYNYCDSALGTHESGDVDRALWLYFLDNFRNNPRNLVQVKQRWDPEDMFHHAQSIPVR
ncbi:MAG: FAD-binding protein [Acidobacteriota bacterium]|nr:FAD-binding protein [Acidobacteriota bacterium]